jgi:hypothetical protein
VRRVVRHPDESCETRQTVFVADVEPSGADALITAIEDMGISVDDYVLTRLGVAIGGGGIDEALGALAVLAVNVALLICTGSLTLLVQRVLPNRSGAPV